MEPHFILGRVRSAAAAAPATGGHQSSLTLSHWDLRILLFLILQGVLLCFAGENYEQTNVNEFEAKEPPFLFFGSCILPVFCVEETQVIVI